MAICLVLAYPIAYFLSMQVQDFKWQLALFLLVMVPFWTSYLIRAVAWLPMLGRHGLINEFLMSIGAIDEPVSFFLYSEFSYTMALVQLYVVLAVGPIFFSLAKIDRTLLEAARDMGATPFQIFREIIAPLSLPGVAIGMIFIFVVVMGEFATAVVVYGGKTSTTGHRDPQLLRHRQLSVRRGQRLHADDGDDDRASWSSCGWSISARSSSDGALDAGARRKARIKAGFSVYYVIFLIFVYGPMFAMFTLSFQGPRGGVTFPMRGLSFYWWEKLTGPSAVGDLKGSLVRSLILAVAVMIITAMFSTMLAMAFRKRFRGSGRAVLRGHGRPDGAGHVCSALVWRPAASTRPSAGLVVFGLRRSRRLDVAVRLSRHDGGVQPLRRPPRGGGARHGSR